jgi:DNA-binding NarL/FixJ family response regulator
MSDERKIRVLCVDDNPGFARLLQVSIDLEPDMESAGRLHSADDLGEEIERSHPDIVLLDLNMPGLDPLTALADLCVRHPEVRFIVLSGYDDPEFVERALTAGARGYVTKGGSAGAPAFLEAIRRVAGGGTAVLV